MLNNIVQAVAVAAILVIAVAWITRRIIDRKNGDGHSPRGGCDDCPLYQKCKEKK